MGSPYFEAPQPSQSLIHSDREFDREPGDFLRTPTSTGRATRDETLIIASFGDAVAVDYAAFASQGSQGETIVIGDERIRRLLDDRIRSMPMDEFLRSTPESRSERDQATSLILFLPANLNESERVELEEFLAVVRQVPIKFVGIISTFRVHLEDRNATEIESHVLGRVSPLCPRVVVLRPGHVLSPNSGVSRYLQRLASTYALMPERLHSCFIEGSELFAAIEWERLAERRPTGAERSWFSAGANISPNLAGRAVGSKNRIYTLLGENLSWRDLLSRRCGTAPGHFLWNAISRLLSWLFVGELIGCVIALLARRSSRVRPWHVRTLTPRSVRELLSLCSHHNRDHVKVVGYNNGVVHFGHRYPGKTIVSTVRCRRVSLAGPQAQTLKAECGVTVRDALDFLARSDREPYVIPNYSYVCLGTSFFVPIHGSAVDYSTVADTICRVVLYDPDRDQIISAARGDLGYVENVYNLQSRLVVLRVYLLTKPKSRYYVHRTTWNRPSASELLTALRNRNATNVEIRQTHARSPKVTVSKYFTELGEASSAALELPRDALGRLWDRLEENPITSYLMHAVGRHLVWHAELFFEPSEFARFWQMHDQLPLRKIQLRLILRDGLPQSPFRDADCVSADLFMWRWEKTRFQDCLETQFPLVRTNPGKHSN